jgi:hypothetical protein
MLRVDFDAPAGCGSAEAFRRGVAARLEHAAASNEVPPARIQVRLTRDGDRVLGELRLSHEQAPADTRTVEGATCDEVVDVLALTAALALQPAAARAAPRPTPPPAVRAPTTRETGPATTRGTAARNGAGTATAGARPAPSAASPRAAREAPAVASAAPPPPPPPVEVAAPPPPPPPPPPEPPAPPPPPPIVERPAPPPHPATGAYLEIGAGAALARILSSSVSSGPGPNLGGGVMLGVAYAREDGIPRSLRLGWLYLPNDFLLPGTDVVDRWNAFTLTACPGWGLRHGALDVQACARTIGGWITATGAVTNPRSASRSWFSGGALLRGGADLGAGFSLELEAGIDAPLFHRQFYITTPLETVAETPPVSLLVGIGLSRRL